VILSKKFPEVIIRAIAKTRAIFAIFDPIAFPTAISDSLDNPEKIDMKISGDDVAIPINKKLAKNPDILCLIEKFSVATTSRFAPYINSNKESRKYKIGSILISLNQI
tara:strand:- start:69 stop:392 length:324 start_codon:yes stop_codon:yes gene_type:complete